MSAQVLIVDDDPMLIASLRRCLQDRYELQTAESGAEALAYLESVAGVPVIISDMRMPVMNGGEFISRASEITPRSKFLMLTGTPSDPQRIRNSHGDLVSRFLTKPCSPDVIAEAIDEALEDYAPTPAVESAASV